MFQYVIRVIIRKVSFQKNKNKTKKQKNPNHQTPKLHANNQKKTLEAVILIKHCKFESAWELEYTNTDSDD